MSQGKNQKNIKNKNVQAVSNNKGKISEADIKKKKRNRIIAISVISTAIVCFTVFIVVVIAFGLGKVKPIKGTEEELRVVGTIDGTDVKYEELRYITLLYKSAYERTYGEGIWDNEESSEKYREKLENEVISNLKNNYAVLASCKSLNIDTNMKEADEYVQEQIEKIIDDDFDGSQKKYKEWLSENNLTDSLLRFICRVDYLESVVLNTMIDNEIYVKYNDKKYDEFIDYVMTDNEYARTIHVFASKSETDIDANEKKIKKMRDIAADLKSIESDSERYEKMKSYIGKSDEYVSGFTIASIDGVYFTRGQMGDEYESTTFELSEYECSDMIETNDGYYVIMRLPKEQEYVITSVTTLLSYYQNAQLNLYKKAMHNSIDFVPNEYFGELDLTKIK